MGGFSEEKNIEVPTTVQMWYQLLKSSIPKIYSKALTEAQTTNTRRKIVVNNLQEAVKKELNLTLPSDIASFLFDYVVVVNNYGA